jgi:hypothetical protein
MSVGVMSLARRFNIKYCRRIPIAYENALYLHLEGIGLALSFVKRKCDVRVASCSDVANCHVHVLVWSILQNAQPARNDISTCR